MGGLGLGNVASCCMEGGCLYKSYAKPTVLHGSEAWRLNESKIWILQGINEIYGKSDVWSTVKRVKCQGFDAGFNETMYQLALANSVCLYGHVLRSEQVKQTIRKRQQLLLKFKVKE